MITTIESVFVHVTGEVVVGRYGDGALALCIEPDDEPHLEKLSTNLIEHGHVAPEGHVYIKEYAEHEGLPEALVHAGVATMAGKQVCFGWGNKCTAQLMKVNDLEKLRRL